MSLSCLRFITLGLALVCLKLTVAKSQSVQKADSLAQQLKKMKSRDTAYALTLGNYAYELVYGSDNPQQADSIARQAERLSRQLNFGPGIYKATVAQAGAQFQLNKPEEAVLRLRQLLVDIDRYKMPVEDKYKTLSNLGVTYRALGRTKEALEVVMQAVQLETRYAIRPRSENVRRTLGFLFRASGQTNKAISYLLEGIAISRENNDLNSQATLEVDLAKLYNDLGQYQQAIDAYTKGLAHSRQGGYTSTQADALNGLAYTYNHANQPQKALPFARQGLQLAKRLDFKRIIANSHYALGIIYQSLKQYSDAETEFQQASAIAQETDDLDNKQLYVTSLAELAALRHDYRTAYTYQLQQQQLKDSLMSNEQKERTDELVSRYESEKKEAQIKLFGQQAQLRDKELAVKQWQTSALLIGGLLIVLLGIAISTWLLNRARIRRLQEAQQLRKQIAHDLHDEVGSTLSSISMLSGHTDTLLSQNQPETAQKMVQKIYSDARQILESIDEIIWTINPGNDSLQRIAQRLRDYAQPLMESKEIHFSFQTDPNVEDVPVSMEVRRNLYLIGKEAINNLVKHSQATHATVRFQRRDSQLQVLIEDNGQGFEQGQVGQRTGQASMQQRAEAMGGSLEVKSTPGHGTRLQLVVSP
ncbi:tetratricopeptide repeat protein [Spirosoma sp. HMF4905]|uniref:histidine kinase n=1 Tax=Spirosoma arboris TaxID=2682092 RepID=A0A7K1SA69_9BACT|nr:tetratricopeptide repeat protein [Spirosoma arboris]MVM30699.1 tetratricopeptide repeat protein [Spirosoma arboris]